MELDTFKQGYFIYHRIVEGETLRERGRVERFERELFHDSMINGYVSGAYITATGDTLRLWRQEWEEEDAGKRSNRVTLLIDPRSYFKLVFRGYMQFNFSVFADSFFTKPKKLYQEEAGYSYLRPLQALSTEINRKHQLVGIKFHVLTERRDYMENGMLGKAVPATEWPEELIASTIHRTISDDKTKKIAMSILTNKELDIETRINLLQKLPE